MKWFIAGLIWTGPNRCQWEELGPFDSEEEANRAWGYRQGRGFTEQRPCI